MGGYVIQLYQILLQKYGSLWTYILYPSIPTQIKEPLEEALKFLVPLQHLSRGCTDTHLMSYSIYSRKSNHPFFLFPDYIAML